MNLYGGNHDDSPNESDPLCVEPSDAPSMTLVIFHLDIYLPSIYEEKYWDVGDLL